MPLCFQVSIGEALSDEAELAGMLVRGRTFLERH